MRLKTTLLAVMTALLGATAAYALPESIGISDPVTENAVEIKSFLKLLLIIISAIVIFVAVLMAYIMVRFREKANPEPSTTTHNTLIEVIWTVVPVLILLALVSPSFKALFNQDIIKDTELTVKVTGDTWLWKYSYPEFEDSIDEIVSLPLNSEEAAAAGKPFLLAADKALVVPSATRVKLRITSNNNLHSFSVDPFGIKMDAIPGIINETWFEVFEGREGTYYGQCAELCGINHYYMPIEIKVVTRDEFDQWVANGGRFSTDMADNQAVTEFSGAPATAAKE